MRLCFLAMALCACSTPTAPRRATMPLAQFNADPWNRCQAHIREIACAGGTTNLSEDIECIQSLHMEYARAYDRLAWLEQYDCEF